MNTYFRAAVRCFSWPGTPYAVRRTCTVRHLVSNKRLRNLPALGHFPPSTKSTAKAHSLASRVSHPPSNTRSDSLTSIFFFFCCPFRTAFLGSTHGIGLRPSLDTISILGSNTPVELDPGAPLVVLWQVRPPVAVGICWSLFGQSIAQTRRHSISAIRHPQPDRPPPSTFRPSKPPLQRPSSLFTVSAPVSEPRLGVCMVFSGTFSLIFGLLAKEPAVRAPR